MIEILKEISPALLTYCTDHSYAFAAGGLGGVASLHFFNEMPEIKESIKDGESVFEFPYPKKTVTFAEHQFPLHRLIDLKALRENCININNQWFPANMPKKAPEIGDEWYQIKSMLVSDSAIDHFGEYYNYGSPRAKLKVNRFVIVKLTPKGVRLKETSPFIRYSRHDIDQIENLSGDSFFVHLDSRKKRAYPTIEQALKAFTKVKQREQSILSARLASSEQAEKLAINLLNKDKNSRPEEFLLN